VIDILFAPDFGIPDNVAPLTISIHFGSELKLNEYA
jgi:hypothetical protein